jgi:hypothetical protein
MDDNRTMPFALPVLLAVVVSTATPGASLLPRGNDLFRLGMSRAEVDSAVAGRQLTVISDGTAYLVCASDDPLVEYEQYSFFLPPHGQETLWKVTVGYRLGTSREDLDRVWSGLKELLGPPTADSSPQAAADGAASEPPPTMRLVMWADASTSVQLGARWSADADRSPDRMLVTWTDRRIQHLVEARSKKDKPKSKE